MDVKGNTLEHMGYIMSTILLSQPYNISDLSQQSERVVMVVVVHFL